MTELMIDKIKKLIETHTNLPLYSFINLSQSQKNANRWIIEAEVVHGADTAYVHTRMILLEIEEVSNEANLVFLRHIKNKRYDYTFACNIFHPPL